jgi:hypothetical protein
MDGFTHFMVCGGKGSSMAACCSPSFGDQSDYTAEFLTSFNSTPLSLTRKMFEYETDWFTTVAFNNIQNFYNSKSPTK